MRSCKDCYWAHQCGHDCEQNCGDCSLAETCQDYMPMDDSADIEQYIKDCRNRQDEYMRGINL